MRVNLVMETDTSWMNNEDFGWATDDLQVELVTPDLTHPNFRAIKISCPDGVVVTINGVKHLVETLTSILEANKNLDI